MRGIVPARVLSLGLRYVDVINTSYLIHTDAGVEKWVRVTFVFSGVPSQPTGFGCEKNFIGPTTHCIFHTLEGSPLHRRTEFWTAKFQELNQLIS